MMNWKELWQLYSVFFRIGGLTFGGGLTMLPMLKYELVQTKDWVTEEELLDYYAVNAAMRGQGCGSRCLHLLREKLQELGYQGVLAEVERVEDPDYLPGSPDDWKARRIRFYEHCGFRQTKLWCCLFTVDFLIMTMDLKELLSDQKAMERMEALYRMMVSEESYNRNVHFFFHDTISEQKGEALP